MRKRVMLLALAATATGAAQALAHDFVRPPVEQIRLGQPAYGGTGCPGGTVSAALSPDGTALSILFDQYTVEAGRATGRRVDRKSCNVAIPVHVPHGYSFAIVQLDYRGFNALPPGAASQLRAEYFFAGRRGPAHTRVFYGPQDQDFLVQDRLAAEAIVWSPCGADVNLRANTSMQVTTNAYGQQALASVDSLDIQAGVIYQIQWRRCSL